MWEQSSLFPRPRFSRQYSVEVVRVSWPVGESWRLGPSDGQESSCDTEGFGRHLLPSDSSRLTLRYLLAVTVTEILYAGFSGSLFTVSRHSNTNCMPRDARVGVAISFGAYQKTLMPYLPKLFPVHTASVCSAAEISQSQGPGARLTFDSTGKLRPPQSGAPESP